jgi:small subunit ribosomal protein S6
MQQTATTTVRKQLARQYELVYILQPNVDPDEADRIAHRVQEVVARFGGKITKVDVWGRRRLAYPIKKHSRGVFVYVRFLGAGPIVAELERNLRNADAVIRFQTIRLEGTYDLAEVQVDPEEVKFTRIEAPPAEEEPEPSVEERLGLTAAPPSEGEEDLGDLDDEEMGLGPDGEEESED